MVHTKILQTLVNLLKKTEYSAKITEIEGKIPTITGLAATAALTTIENKIPDVSNVLEKQIITQKY